MLFSLIVQRLPRALDVGSPDLESGRVWVVYRSAPCRARLMHTLRSSIALMWGTFGATSPLSSPIPHPPSASFVQKKRSDVIKCNHFSVKWPSPTLNTTSRGLLRPALRRANVIQNLPVNPLPAPEQGQPRANVINFNVVKCRDTRRNLPRHQ
jgi:hypothetical protein